MKTLLSVLFLALSCSVFSQSEAYVDALKNFETDYNNKNAEAIHKMFDPVMKASVDINKSEEIVTTFHSNYGNLNSTSYISHNETLEKYIGHFTKGKLTIFISLNAEGKINTLLFRPYTDDTPSKIERTITPLALPFKGEWFTFWGGDTKPQNYHVISRTQKHAFDFIILDKNNRSYERSGTRNEDYYAFGKPLYAISDAQVIKVIKDIPDNRPGEMNPKQSLGNHIILKTDNDEYIVYAHFEQHTIKFDEGALVKKHQYLGNCGNSGNSSEPHLHLHIQDGPDPLNAGGVKAYFKTINVNGVIEEDYSPVKNDRISPSNTGN